MSKKLYKFGVVSREVITAPDLSMRAKALYSVLACYANKKRSCFPSISTISDDLNISQRTTKRLIKELKDKDYIKRAGRKLIIT